MKYKRLLIFLLVVTILCSFSLCASADMGPKPSVVLNFEGIDNEVYYVTLLSKAKSTGPYSYSKYDDTSNYADSEYPDEDLDAYQAFRTYRDSDKFYFVNYFKRSNEQNTFRWGYYPPSVFKVLLYFPRTNTFAVSGVSERYAFDSYFTVTLSIDGTLSAESQDTPSDSSAPAETLTLRKSYNYSMEAVSLVVRIVLTITVEMLIALLFGLRQKNVLIFVAAINTSTQILLNILLNVSNYSSGSMVFVFNYVWMELLIIVAETVAYSFYFRKSAIKKWVAPIYSVTSNVVSFVVGLLLAHWIPGIF